TREVMPVRNVPEGHRAETSRRSGGPLRPSAISGGSLPSLAITSCVSCIRNGCFPRAVSSPLACHDICLSWRAKSTNAAYAALSKSAGACIGADHAWSFRTPLRREWGLQVRHCKHLPLGKETAAEPVRKKSSQKTKKKMEIAVDTSRSSRLYTPHQRR